MHGERPTFVAVDLHGRPESTGAAVIDAFVTAVASGAAPDAEIEAWLRGIFEHGLSADDTFALTMALARSGETIDWSGLERPIVDKHSTGGVGDAVSLIAVPVAAAAGARVAKLSGRALGHTGGTIDKLESIPGFRTELDVDELRATVARVGCAIAATGPTLAPAEKRIYALRDRTGLVASIPLIASSVMCKKIAAGADAIVLDVKYGRGAFMERANDARELADAMRAIGARAGRKVTALLTNMDEPLADSIGDALELDESLTVLENNGGSRALRDVALSVASAMIAAGSSGTGRPSRSRDATSPHAAAAAALNDGRALAKFREMAAAQGGAFDDFVRSWKPGTLVRARAGGRVDDIDARAIGEAVADTKHGLSPDQAKRIGVRLKKRPGAIVRTGDVLLECWLPADRVARLASAVSVVSEERA